MWSSVIVTEPNWKPLERLFWPEECSAFMYMGQTGTTELYKHREKRRYLNIEASTGEFCLQRGGYIKISKAAALAYVFG